MYKRGQFNETIAIFGQAWLVQAASRGMRRKFISFTRLPHSLCDWSGAVCGGCNAPSQRK